MSRRRTTWMTVIAMVWALLASQAAIAAHACRLAQQASDVAAMAEAGMPCAESMQAALGGEVALCHAHCQGSGASADHFQPQSFTPSFALGAVLTIPVAHASPRGSPEVDHRVTQASAGPPLAIANCCFRI